MKWKSPWPIFHSPVILPYILKTIWCVNIVLWDYDVGCVEADYESIWPSVWPQNKCRSLWLYFMVQWFCLVSWRLFYVWTSYFGILSQYDTTFDLKINVGHCDLCFMIQLFCLISWIFDVWTSYFGLMSQYDTMFDLKINVGHCDLYFMVHWFCLISWKLFHGPVILLYILKTIQWLSILLWDLESVWPDFWPKINVGHSDIYFTVQWFFFFYFLLWKTF